MFQINQENLNKEFAPGHLVSKHSRIAKILKTLILWPINWLTMQNRRVLSGGDIFKRPGTNN